jgi:hypothetical protein
VVKTARPGEGAATPWDEIKARHLPAFDRDLDGISKQTMEDHYKLYERYVKKTNECCKPLNGFSTTPGSKATAVVEAPLPTPPTPRPGPAPPSPDPSPPTPTPDPSPGPQPVPPSPSPDPSPLPAPPPPSI